MAAAPFTFSVCTLLASSSGVFPRSVRWWRRCMGGSSAVLLILRVVFSTWKPHLYVSSAGQLVVAVGVQSTSEKEVVFILASECAF